MKFLKFTLLICLIHAIGYGQNSMVGDGFGGRLWYKPYNYTVGSYSGFTICGDDKQLYGWGANRYFELGDPTIFPGTNTAIPIPEMNHVKYYSTGYLMGAIKDDGTGWVWGTSYNLSSQKHYPTKILDDVKFVDAGMNICCFVKNDGTVWSVGVNSGGQFGNGSSSNSFTSTPVLMNYINNAVRVAQGGKITSVLLANGKVMYAGSGLDGYRPNPIQLDSLPYIIDIKANTNGTIALDSTGHVWFWGFISSSPNPMSLVTPTPKLMPVLKDVVAISGCNDGAHFLALDKNHDCYSWGHNSLGQCGYDQSMSTIIPTKVMSNVNDIMAGETFSYLIKTDGTLFATGGSGGGGSIWMNLPNENRTSFTQINPQSDPMFLCGTDNTGSPGELAPTHLIHFPNAFTPNGDSKNDFFRAITSDKSLIESYDLKIFNRFGNLVFQTKNIESGWDGSRADLSTYFYYCKYKPFSGKYLERKGDVLLIR